MKILLINESFYPDVSATAQHLTDLALGLKAEGNEVCVLCSDVCYENSKVKNPQEEMYQGIKIIRIKGKHASKESRGNRVLQALRNHLSFASKLLAIGKFDRVVVLTSPPMIAFWGMLYCRLKRAKLFYWVMDLNPDEAIAAGWLNEKSFTACLLERLHRLVLRQCEVVIVLDHFMKDRILLKTPIKRIEVIAPWNHDEDLELIDSQENLFIKENNLQGKFIVMYAGNHSLCHPIDLFLETAKLLKANEEAVFIFSGGGPRVNEVTNFKRLHRLNNIIQFSYQPRERVKYLLSAADLHLISMGKDFVGIVHPCKIYGVLKLNKPFVFYGPEESPVGELIQKTSLGFQATNKEAEKLAEWILKLKSIEKIDHQTSELAELNQRFSKKTLLPRMIQILST